MNNKKLTSTILLFVVFIGFLLWGLYTLLHPADPENVIYGILLLGCSAYAGISILMLPWKKER
jgi:hypothetical protein